MRLIRKRTLLHPQERRKKALLDATFAGLTNLVRCRQNNRFYLVKGRTRESQNQ